MDYSVLDCLPTGVIILDRENKNIVFANKALYSLLPFLNDKKLGNLAWTKLIPQNSDVDWIQASAKSQLASSGSFQLELMLDEKQYKLKWVLAKGKATEFDGRQLVFITLSDISSTKQINERFFQKSLELEMINESVPGGIVIMDNNPSFTITYANRGYYDLVGYTKEEIAQIFQNKAISLINPSDLPGVLESFKEQLSKGNKFNIKARLVKKSGELIWISFDGIFSYEPDGNGKIYCVLVDINRQVQLMEELLREQEHNRIILELTDDILFDYDLSKNTISFSGNFTDRYKLPSQFEGFPQSILDLGIIYEDDITEFLALIEKIKKGISDHRTEIRIKRVSGEIIWYSVDYKLIFNNKSNPVMAIGKMTNITEQKNKIHELEVKAETDPLTKLFNKQETQERISKCLDVNPFDEEFVLMLIDIDNFKGVNDTLGHHYGDAVLVDIAKKIRQLFRDSDIVGRVGGDEFVVFMRNISSLEVIERKASILTDAFRNTFSGDNSDYKISGSIGIVFSPKDGVTYEELFKKADIALYQSKRMGKDCFTIYDEEAFYNKKE